MTFEVAFVSTASVVEYVISGISMIASSLVLMGMFFKRHDCE
jgi:hypothetical protein